MPYTFVQSGTVREFEGMKGPAWWYIDVDKKHMSYLLEYPVKYGLYKAKLTLSEYSWLSSIMPKGGGKYFIALPAKVRNKFKIGVGDKIVIHAQAL